MTQVHEEIASAALSLPPEERAELADRLWDSLDPRERSAVDAVWAEIVERRIDQLDRGEIEPLPGDAVIAELRKRCR